MGSTILVSGVLELTVCHARVELPHGMTTSFHGEVSVTLSVCLFKTHCWKVAATHKAEYKKRPFGIRLGSWPVGARRAQTSHRLKLGWRAAFRRQALTRPHYAYY